MPDVNLTVSPPVAPLVTITPASVFISLGNVVGAVGSATSQYSIQGTGAVGNPYQLVGDASAPGNWQFYGTNGSGVKGWLAQGASTQFSLIGNGVAGTPLQLSGDVATPGNNVFYGTNASGVRGFYTPPVANSTTAGYVPTPPNNTTTFLRGDATFAIPPSATATTVGYVPLPPNNVTTFLRGDATFATPPSATATVAGYVPTPPNNTTTFLRGDATFATPPSATATVAGYVPTPPNNQTTFLRGDATFAAITAGAETFVASNLGTVSTNQTVNCAGACAVHIRLTLSAAVTLTLNNLTVGVPVSIAASASGSFTLKLAGTDPSSVAYAITGYNSSGVTSNMVSSGLPLTSSTAYVLVGNSAYVTGTPNMDLNIG